MPPASTSWAALSRESIPWNQGYPERGWSPSPPSGSPWNSKDPLGKREGRKPGVREATLIPRRREALLFPHGLLLSPPGRTPEDPKTRVLGRWAPGLEADTPSHLWYLWLFPECPGVGKGLRGDERSLLGVPLQWGSVGATLGEAVPLSQNGRRRWRRNWGRWMPRGGLTGPHRPLEEKGESKTELEASFWEDWSARPTSPAARLPCGHWRQPAEMLAPSSGTEPVGSHRWLLTYTSHTAERAAVISTRS